jgi:hypothetical protein
VRPVHRRQPGRVAGHYLNHGRAPAPSPKPHAGGWAVRLAFLWAAARATSGAEWQALCERAERRRAASAQGGADSALLSVWEAAQDAARRAAAAAGTGGSRIARSTAELHNALGVAVTRSSRPHTALGHFERACARAPSPRRRRQPRRALRRPPAEPDDACRGRGPSSPAGDRAPGRRFRRWLDAPARPAEFDAFRVSGSGPGGPAPATGPPGSAQRG